MDKGGKESKGIENLRPVRSEAEAREKGSRGGIASGESRREKKRMSQIYADFLAEEFEIEIDEDLKKLSGVALVKETMKKVILRGDSSSVSLLKEIREGTEGNKMSLTGADGEPLNFSISFVKSKDAAHPNK